MFVAAELIEQMYTNLGASLLEMSKKKPVLLVFLRHFGCNFCRESLEEISKIKPQIVNSGAELVFVHMADKETGDRYFERYNMPGVSHVSDSECHFYAGFGLVKGSLNQLFGLQTLIRGVGGGGFSRGFALGKQLGDAFQMPGIFVISQGEVKESFVHKYVSDRPDYIRMAQCCSLPDASNN